MGSIPGLGRSPGGGHGNSLQYSCLDRGAWRATVHGVEKSWTWLKRLSTHACMLPQEALKSNRLSTLTLCFIFKTHSYYSRSSLRKWKWRSLSPVQLIVTPWTVHGLLQARILEWVAFPFSRGSSQPGDPTPCLPHCRQILYQLSHKGSPRILEWVAYPFFSGSSRPRNQSGVSCIAGVLFTNWAIREALNVIDLLTK